MADKTRFTTVEASALKKILEEAGFIIKEDSNTTYVREEETDSNVAKIEGTDNPSGLVLTYLSEHGESGDYHNLINDEIDGLEARGR